MKCFNDCPFELHDFSKTSRPDKISLLKPLQFFNNDFGAGFGVGIFDVDRVYNLNREGTADLMYLVGAGKG